MGQQVSAYFSINKQQPDRASQFFEDTDSVRSVGRGDGLALLLSFSSWPAAAAGSNVNACVSIMSVCLSVCLFFALL